MVPKEFRESNGYVIYVHQSPSNKVYIGKTKQKPIDRWGYGGINYFYNRNTKFSNAIKKYGWNRFEHYIIAKNLTLEQANYIEKALIHYHRDVLNNCYNLADGGEGNGHLHTEKTKRKLSLLNKGHSVSEETKLKMAKASGKPVIVTFNGGTKEFYSIGKAAKFLGLSVSGLKVIISNQRFTNPKVRGMVINYKEVNNDN